MKNIIFFLFLYPCFVLSQETFRIMTYNVENLFESAPDSIPKPHDFTPGSARRWTYHRYVTKQNHLARCIIATGEWTPPALVGLCEIENPAVLDHLTRFSILRHAGYRYVMTDGPDPRGMNVALLYQRESFRLLEYTGHRICDPTGRNYFLTRDILHVSGQILSGDTLDVLMVHFPSRRNGQKESEIRRLIAADRLKELADSLIQIRTFPLVVLMGDFNDNPHSPSLKKTMGALSPEGARSKKKADIHPELLYNLMEPLKKEKTGTYKFQGKWEILDHILVNGNLLSPDSPLYIPAARAAIIRHTFLLQPDPKDLGVRPFRTYYGYRFHGGYSDHLPVAIDCVIHY